MRRSWKSVARDLALFAGLFLAIQLWQTRHAVSGPAPSLIGPAIGGSQLDLSSFRGKPVMVYFWATWCGVCSAQAHNIDAVVGRFAVVTVAVSSGSTGDIVQHLKARGSEWPVVEDPEGQLSQAWKVGAYPTSIFVDANGIVRSTSVGYTSEWGLRARMAWAALW